MGYADAEGEEEGVRRGEKVADLVIPIDRLCADVLFSWFYMLTMMVFIWRIVCPRNTENHVPTTDRCTTRHISLHSIRQ